MPNIVLAKSMLRALRGDFYEALHGGSRNLRHIDISSYSKKFKVKAKDIEAYCQTLTPMVPIHPVCVICGSEWGGYDKIIKPIANGQIIDWVDSFDMFCAGKNHTEHRSLWYSQDKNGSCSFELELPGPNDKEYQVRWNCHCGVPECYGKTVLALMSDANTPYTDYKIIKEFDSLPYNTPQEEYYKLIEEAENNKLQ
jgi:hypothetical protein